MRGGRREGRGTKGYLHDWIMDMYRCNNDWNAYRKQIVYKKSYSLRVASFNTRMARQLVCKRTKTSVKHLKPILKICMEAVDCTGHAHLHRRMPTRKAISKLFSLTSMHIVMTINKRNATAFLYTVCCITRAQWRRKRCVCNKRNDRRKKKQHILGKTALHRNNILQTRAMPPSLGQPFRKCK